MTTIRIIGVGSPFGSDRIGWDAVDQLTEGANTNEVSFIALDRPGVSLLDYMQNVESVVLVDAIKAGMAPGSVMRLEEDQIELSNSINSTHGFGIAEALSLGRTLNNLPENLVLIGMEIGKDPEWQPSSGHMEALIILIDKEIDCCTSDPVLN